MVLWLVVWKTILAALINSAVGVGELCYSGGEWRSGTIYAAIIYRNTSCELAICNLQSAILQLQASGLSDSALHMVCRMSRRGI